ncbi:hypothetical protein [Vibrio anguillarum]|uniref:hypothetical protein n=11 Tax=Vibrio anguillarum TaxID=55601 RepID=UPI000BB506C7|nr:hypothetical protein [Vibrio anguillarum]ATC59486.1 hypothetical protein CMV05_18580 [Vibrio anguillarum]MBF4253243.1 hypothetical protein [Vibrio anguillarum]MBF4296064.1 hypothetical protein [Vibrio anguillarum]MBF4388981.1 hypothetical protein [Vibrio anguillarum]MBF4404862.1 hypothetical protein [Vibrio anguillarum]
MRSAINTALFILFLLLAFLTSVASHADEPLCPVGITTGSKTWTWSKYGNSPYICVRSCRYAVVASVCTDTLDACSSDFISTGVVCSDPDSMVSGGEYPDIPTPPDDSIPIFNGSNPDSASVFTAKNLYKLDYSRSFGKLNNRIDNTYKALDSRFSNLSTDMSQTRTTVSDAASRLNVATKSIHSLSDNITSMSGEFVNTRNLINSKHDDLISDNDTTHANQETIKKRF